MVLTMLSGFTILAAGWLFTMYLILRHPGFEWRAAMALGFVVASGVIVAAVHRRPPGVGHLIVAAAAAIALAATGAWAVTTNHAPGAGFEGFIDVIGLALVLQGTLAGVWIAVRLLGARRISVTAGSSR